MLQYLQDPPPPPTISSPSDKCPLDQSAALSPAMTSPQTPIGPSSTDWSSPPKPTLTTSNKTWPPKKRTTKRSWMTVKRRSNSWKPDSSATSTPSPNHPTGTSKTVGSPPSLSPAEESPHDLLHMCEIYASPKYTADPVEPLPHWIHETLQGPAPGYAALLDVVKATDDWGLEADVIRFRNLDERVIAYKAQLDRTHGELKSTIIAQDQCQGQLECARLPERISHLAGEPTRMPTNRWACGGWKEGRGRHF